ncbi:MAG: class 1 isoprenoid biosynthesis enzyme [Planctomycetota bacterium]|jgi:hypothetical protein
MTLAPVFRSPEAVNALESKGYWAKMESSFAAHREADRILHDLLESVLDPRYLEAEPIPADDLPFLQENFFLILFRSLFETLKCEKEHLDCYTLLNICIRGLVLCGDNLFDDEEKLVLPLKLGQGRRFLSIVQMMSFQNLLSRVLDQHGGWLEADEKVLFHKNLLSTLTDIGHLEGSEEAGVDEVPPVKEMIDHVHRVRGGSLFSLAFIAPRIGERGANQAAWESAEEGIRCLGTAFQIVDDLTDLEFDLGRRSHNLLVAQVVHEGTEEEKSLLEELTQSSKMRSEGGWVEKGFQASAGKVLTLAKEEAESGLKILESLGFWFQPQDALLFIRAIAGDAGFERVQGLQVS